MMENTKKQYVEPKVEIIWFDARPRMEIDGAEEVLLPDDGEFVPAPLNNDGSSDFYSKDV